MAAVTFAEEGLSLVLSDTLDEEHSRAGRMPLDPPSPTSVFEVEDMCHAADMFQPSSHMGLPTGKSCPDPSVVESCHYRLPQLRLEEVPSLGQPPSVGASGCGETCTSSGCSAALRPATAPNPLSPGYQRLVPGASRAGFTEQSCGSSVSPSRAASLAQQSPQSPQWDHSPGALIRDDTGTTFGWAESVAWGDLAGSTVVDATSPAHSKVMLRGGQALLAATAPGEQHAQGCDAASSVGATTCAEKYQGCAAALAKADSDRPSCCDATRISDDTPRGLGFPVRPEPHSPTQARVPAQSDCSLSTAASWHGGPPPVPRPQPPPGSSVGASTCSQAVGVGDSWTRLQEDAEMRGDASAVGEGVRSPRPEILSVRFATDVQQFWASSPFDVSACEGRARLASLVEAPDMASPVAQGNARHLDMADPDASSEVPGYEGRGRLASLVEAADVASPLAQGIARQLQMPDFDASSEVPDCDGRGRVASLVDVPDMASPLAQGLARQLGAPHLEASQEEADGSCIDDGACSVGQLPNQVLPPVGQIIARSSSGSHVGSDAAPSNVSHVESEGAPSMPSSQRSGPTCTSRNMSVISPTWLADDVRVVPGTSAANSEQCDGEAIHPPSIYLDGVLMYNNAPANHYSMDDATRISGPTQAHWDSGPLEPQEAPCPPVPSPADSSFGTPNAHANIHAGGIQADREFAPLEFASTVATGADRQSNDVASTIATDGHVQFPIGDMSWERMPAGASELGSSTAFGDLQATVTAALVL